MTDSNYIAEWIGVDATQPTPVAYIYDDKSAQLDEITLPGLAPDTLAAELTSYLGDHDPTPVICAGTRFVTPSGFGAVPTAPLAGIAEIQGAGPRIRLLALPGLRQKQPLGVMQGAETMIAGLLAQHPNFDGVSLTIGASTAWAQISAGEVVSFQSFLTPELGETLADRIGAAPSASQGLDDTVFNDAVDAMLSRPQNFAAVLAEIQAAASMDALTPEDRYARLAGSLIGVELSAARPYWLGQQVAIIGAAPLAPLYDQALLSQGVQTQMFDSRQMVQAGLVAAFARYKSQT